MSSNENIQRLKEKRKALEDAHRHSPTRSNRGDQAIDITGVPTIVAEPDNISNGMGNNGGSTAKAGTTTERKNGGGMGRPSNAFSTTVLEHIQFLEHKVQALEGLEKRLKGVEKITYDVEEEQKTTDEVTKYPSDSYSLIALNGPNATVLWYEWWGDFDSFFFFMFGLSVFLFQSAFHGMMLFGETNLRWGTIQESLNPDSASDFFATFIPANTNSVVKGAQVVSLLAYVVFPDSTLQDLMKAYQFFPRWCSDNGNAPVWAIRFACILRGVQAILGICNVWVLVMTSNTVLDIILSFTAINFISSIDNHAYSLAKRGIFGSSIKSETSNRIPKKKLPPGMQRKSNHVSYCILLTCAALVLFGFMIAMMGYQESETKWLTETFRMQFNGEIFKDYSGCFQLNTDSSHFRRYTYNSFDQGSKKNTSIGYCRDDRKWYLVDGIYNDAFDPCTAVGKGVELASSSQTDSFDISSSFDDTWKSFGGAPLDLYFLGSTNDKMEDELYCGLALGDGICDVVFNTASYRYDDGDCCAATCTGSNCVENVIPSAFGSSDASATGFPNCNDPNMVPITINLDAVASSRALLDTSNLDSIRSTEAEWREETPSATYFALTCEGKAVLTVYIEESMANNSETVMVPDGARCTLVVKNSSQSIDKETSFSLSNTEFMTPEPIWYFDYTLYQGVDGEVKILNRQSSQKGDVSFNLIPNCYLETLKNQIDAGTIYDTASDPSNKAIGWLVEDDPEISVCGDYDFIERYTLTKMNFAMNEPTNFISRENHCRWSPITCAGGRVDTVELGFAGLTGEIPSEISLLAHLKKLDIGYNEISSIPEEIGFMSSLLELDLDGNQLSSIPTEIGFLTNLEELALSYNKITSLPTEIGLMSSLELLGLAGNQLSSISTEIGLLTSLEELYLHGNQFPSIPTEIGLMSSLQKLTLNGNKLKSIPSEIGRLTSLQELLIFDNTPLLTIPSEIELLTSSHNLTLYGQNITCNNLPGEIAVYCLYSI